MKSLFSVACKWFLQILIKTCEKQKHKYQKDPPWTHQFPMHNEQDIFILKLLPLLFQLFLF